MIEKKLQADPADPRELNLTSDFSARETSGLTKGLSEHTHVKDGINGHDRAPAIQKIQDLSRRASVVARPLNGSDNGRSLDQGEVAEEFTSAFKNLVKEGQITIGNGEGQWWIPKYIQLALNLRPETKRAILDSYQEELRNSAINAGREGSLYIGERTVLDILRQLSGFVNELTTLSETRFKQSKHYHLDSVNNQYARGLAMAVQDEETLSQRLESDIEKAIKHGDGKIGELTLPEFKNNLRRFLMDSHIGEDNPEMAAEIADKMDQSIGIAYLKVLEKVAMEAKGKLTVASTTVYNLLKEAFVNDEDRSKLFQIYWDNSPGPSRLSQKAMMELLEYGALEGDYLQVVANFEESEYGVEELLKDMENDVYILRESKKRLDQGDEEELKQEAKVQALQKNIKLCQEEIELAEQRIERLSQAAERKSNGVLNRLKSLFSSNTRKLKNHEKIWKEVNQLADFMEGKKQELQSLNQNLEAETAKMMKAVGANEDPVDDAVFYESEKFKRQRFELILRFQKISEMGDRMTEDEFARVSDLLNFRLRPRMESMDEVSLHFIDQREADALRKQLVGNVIGDADNSWCLEEASRLADVGSKFEAKDKSKFPIWTSNLEWNTQMMAERGIIDDELEALLQGQIRAVTEGIREVPFVMRAGEEGFTRRDKRISETKIEKQPVEQTLRLPEFKEVIAPSHFQKAHMDHAIASGTLGRLDISEDMEEYVLYAVRRDIRARAAVAPMILGLGIAEEYVEKLPFSTGIKRDLEREFKNLLNEAWHLGRHDERGNASGIDEFILGMEQDLKSGRRSSLPKVEISESASMEDVITLLREHASKPGVGSRSRKKFLYAAVKYFREIAKRMHEYRPHQVKEVFSILEDLQEKKVRGRNGKSSNLITDVEARSIRMFLVDMFLKSNASEWEKRADLQGEPQRYIDASKPWQYVAGLNPWQYEDLKDYKRLGAQYNQLQANFSAEIDRMRGVVEARLTEGKLTDKMARYAHRNLGYTEYMLTKSVYGRTAIIDEQLQREEELKVKQVAEAAARTEEEVIAIPDVVEWAKTDAEIAMDFEPTYGKTPSGLGAFMRRGWNRIVSVKNRLKEWWNKDEQQSEVRPRGLLNRFMSHPITKRVAGGMALAAVLFTISNDNGKTGARDYQSEKSAVASSASPDAKIRKGPKVDFGAESEVQIESKSESGAGYDMENFVDGVKLAQERVWDSFDISYETANDYYQNELVEVAHQIADHIKDRSINAAKNVEASKTFKIHSIGSEDTVAGIAHAYYYGKAKAEAGGEEMNFSDMKWAAAIALHNGMDELPRWITSGRGGFDGKGHLKIPTYEEAKRLVEGGQAMNSGLAGLTAQDLVNDYYQTHHPETIASGM